MILCIQDESSEVDETSDRPLNHTGAKLNRGSFFYFKKCEDRVEKAVLVDTKAVMV